MTQQALRQGEGEKRGWLQFGFHLLGQVGSGSCGDVTCRWAAPWLQLVAQVKLLPTACSAVDLCAAQLPKAAV